MADASPLPEGFQLDQAPSTTSNAGAATDTPVQTSELPEGFQLDEQKYGGTAQTIQAGLEGALRGAVSSPIASAIETKLGLASPAGIAARQEQHPVVGGIGEASTLIGGALTGTGEAAALESIGKGAVEAAGLAKAAPTYVARVGSAIVKNAAEMAAYQAQDEAGKALLSDPNVGAQSAIANIGLAAALGGAGGGLISGVASPLWEMAAGSKIAGGLRALVDHVGGTEAEVGAAPLSKAQTLAEQAGVEIPKDYAAVVNGTPGAMVQHSYLSQDDSTIFGRRYQKAGQELYSNLGTRVAEALGKTPDEVMNLPEKNLYETGQNLGATLHSELKKEIEPISNAYDAVTNKFKAAPVTSDVIRSISDQLAQKSLSEGWGKSFDDANQKLIEKIMQKLPEQATINDLKNAVSNLYRPFDAPDLRAAVVAKNIM